MPSEVPTSTRNLYIFQNGIESLRQEDFIGLENLEMLDLSQNKLTELPDRVFEPLATLRNLDLSSNSFTHISEETFAGLKLLERLYLHSNTIKSIHPAAFDGLEQLLELKLQGNAITSMPTLKMPHLLLLDLRFNKIPVPTPDDLQTPKLEALKLGGLGLHSLDDSLFSGFKNLHDLDLSNNQMNVFPLALQKARGLVILNLAGNPMGPLNWKDFENLNELKELDMSNLSLQNLPENMTLLFPHLKKLTVAKNPFNCMCTLAWFPSWLRNQNILLGRKEETRCHFPPRNAGKILEELGHQDFGCPTKTVIPASTVKATTLAPLLITSSHITTRSVQPVKPSKAFSSETDNYLNHPILATPSTEPDLDLRRNVCPPYICLNGGTCWLNYQNHFECTCPPWTTGRYCENMDDSSVIENAPTPKIPEGEIIAQMVTSSSILLDLYRYIEMRPYIRGVRLTYRNLSGPDKRPKQLNIPSSYPEYTLRGLLPNSTYFVCASPLGEPSNVDSVCTEAQTADQVVVSGRVGERMTTMLVPAVAILLLLVLVAVAVGVVCFIRRKKTHLELYCDPSQLELDGVKIGLDNGALPPKQAEVMSSSTVTQNGGLEYEVPLMANNMSSLKPS